MGTQGESERTLRELATGRDWFAPGLRKLRTTLEMSRSTFTSQSRELFSNWTGEAAAAARVEASNLIDYVATIEAYCQGIETAIESDNIRRQDNGEAALGRLPDGEISDPTLRALAQGASIASPLTGGLITFATKGLLDAYLANQRDEAAKRELRKLAKVIQSSADDLVTLKTEHVSLNENFDPQGEGAGPESSQPIGRRFPAPWTPDGSRDSLSGVNGNGAGSLNIGIPGHAGIVTSGSENGSGSAESGAGSRPAGGGSSQENPSRPPISGGSDVRPIPGGGGNGNGPGGGIGGPGVDVGRGPSQDSSLNGIGGGPGVGLRGGLAGAVGLAAGAKLAGGSGGALGAGGVAGVGGGVGGLGGGAGVSGSGGLLGGNGAAGAGSGSAGASAAGKAAGASAGAGRPGGSGLLGGGQGAGGANAEKKRSGSGGYIAPKFEEDPERGPASLAAGPGKRVKKKPAEQ